MIKSYPDIWMPQKGYKGVISFLGHPESIHSLHGLKYIRMAKKICAIIYGVGLSSDSLFDEQAFFYRISFTRICCVYPTLTELKITTDIFFAPCCFSSGG